MFLKVDGLMSNSLQQPPMKNTKGSERLERRSKALRSNLKRRKMQSRERSEDNAGSEISSTDRS